MDKQVISKGKWFSLDAEAFLTELDRLASENPDYKIVLEDLKESIGENTEGYFSEETGEVEDFVSDDSRQVICGQVGEKFACLADNLFMEAFENLI